MHFFCLRWVEQKIKRNNEKKKTEPISATLFTASDEHQGVDLFNV